MAIGRPRIVALCVSIAALALLVFAAPAMGDFLEDQLHKTNAEKRQVQVKIKKVNSRSAVLTTQLAKYQRRIDALNRPIAVLDARIANLEAGIASRSARIVRLRAQFAEQRVEIQRLEVEVGVARKELAERLVTLYIAHDSNLATWVSGSARAGELIDRAEYVGLIAELHLTVLRRIQDLNRKVRIERARNHTIQASIKSDIATIAANQASIERDRAKLAAKLAAVDAIRAKKSAYLARLARDKHDLEDHLDGLQEDSQALKDAINNGGVFTGGSFGTNSGLIWPVNGPIVSTFGMRWGRMHEGVDIAVGTGTPIHAAASGVVVHAGWMGGYGNLVLVQHSGSFVTAYAHQSQIASTVGQFVGQGQILGFIGCTGHCFGPHLHFETRIGGNAVDPMQFL